MNPAPAARARKVDFCRERAPAAHPPRQQLGRAEGWPHRPEEPRQEGDRQAADNDADRRRSFRPVRPVGGGCAHEHRQSGKDWRHPVDLDVVMQSVNQEINRRRSDIGDENSPRLSVGRNRGPRLPPRGDEPTRSRGDEKRIGDAYLRDDEFRQVAQLQSIGGNTAELLDKGLPPVRRVPRDARREDRRRDKRRRIGRRRISPAAQRRREHHREGDSAKEE